MIVEFEVRFIDPEENAAWSHSYNSLTNAVLYAINHHDNNNGCATIRKKVTVVLDDGERYTSYVEILKVGHKSIESIDMTFDQLYDLLKSMDYNMNTVIDNWAVDDFEISKEMIVAIAKEEIEATKRQT